MIPPLRAGSAGFTLVEVLAALAVAGMVAAAIVTGVRALSRWSSGARERARRANRAAAVRAQLADWLAAAAAPARGEAGGFRFRDGTAGQRWADDELAWTTLAASPFSSGQTHVRLFVDRDSTTREAGLVAELTEGEVVRRVELARDVRGLDLRFRHGAAGGAWTTDWGSSVQRPRAVEVTLAGDGLSALLAAPLPVTLSGP